MRTHIFSAALLAAVLADAPASATETCRDTPHQFGKMRHCVMSVRPPHGKVTFGPEHLAATSENSWCANAEKSAGLTTVMLIQRPAQVIRTLYIASGFEKSDDVARQGRRIKRAMIETDRGFKGFVSLKDSADSQKVLISKGRTAWIRLSVLETYPGPGFPGVCISQFLADLEEFANN